MDARPRFPRCQDPEAIGLGPTGEDAPGAAISDSGDLGLPPDVRVEAGGAWSRWLLGQWLRRDLGAAQERPCELEAMRVVQQAVAERAGIGSDRR